MHRWVSLLLVFTCFPVSNSVSFGQDQTTDATRIEIGDSCTLAVPNSWVRKQPRSEIVEHEFAIPAVEGDAAAGRIIMMGAGGSVQANIDRWIGQFSQPDGSETRQRATTAEKAVAGQTIHVVDVRGTYKDRPRGPMGPAEDKTDYRMLGAVIVTQDSGSYFVKLYGPEQTVASGEASFMALLDSLQSKP